MGYPNQKYILHPADYYLIPGGVLKADETPEECCTREVCEETGYIVKPVFHFLTINEYYEEYKFISHYFLCELYSLTVWQDPLQRQNILCTNYLFLQKVYFAPKRRGLITLRKSCCIQEK